MGAYCVPGVTPDVIDPLHFVNVWGMGLRRDESVSNIPSLRVEESDLDTRFDARAHGLSNIKTEKQDRGQLGNRGSG